MDKKDFKVIVSSGRQIRRPDGAMYCEALSRFLNEHEGLFEAVESLTVLHDCFLDELKRFLWLSVKVAIATKQREGEITAEDVRERMELMISLVDSFSVFTPRELLQMYPITKRYDGDRWQEKDYFYTMEKLRALNMDRPIHGQADAFELLTDYLNHDVDLFVVEVMMAISRMRQLEGHPGIMEEFMAEQGVTPLIMHKKEGYIYDPAAGRSYPISKPRPRIPKWLKVLEGRKQDESD